MRVSVNGSCNEHKKLNELVAIQNLQPTFLIGGGSDDNLWKAFHYGSFTDWAALCQQSWVIAEHDQVFHGHNWKKFRLPRIKRVNRVQSYVICLKDFQNLLRLSSEDAFKFTVSNILREALLHVYFGLFIGKQGL